MLRAADIFLDNDVQIEAAPSKHAIAQGFFLYGFEPGGNRVEVTTGGYFVYDPDPSRSSGREAERAKGQAWGVQDRRELPHLRHAAGLEAPRKRPDFRLHRNHRTGRLATGTHGSVTPPRATAAPYRRRS